jgi:hypothetical protein
MHPLVRLYKTYECFYDYYEHEMRIVLPLDHSTYLSVLYSHLEI